MLISRHLHRPDPHARVHRARSMVHVARAMIDPAKHRAAPKPPTAGFTRRQITAGHAAALGFATNGQLRPGAAAHLLLVKPDIDRLKSPDLLGTFWYARDHCWLRETIVARRPARHSSPGSRS